MSTDCYFIGGPRDGDPEHLGCLTSQERQGTIGGRPAFLTYARWGGQMLFLGWLPWGEPALRAALESVAASRKPLP